ncbi:spore coat protein U-like protein [Povalibacter uvarum]|uniref:Spore coat protein U-like protein n=1 Tax=Povalibacter uvarum TaxID=732238 RepID=A0A841HVK6_9GAMM|nr:spore coat U domain-containing protein [Povalibacter uvarum]MBB6096289.1 spore coat protein U-like protein [Povalibacter uvarum]
MLPLRLLHCSFGVALLVASSAAQPATQTANFNVTVSIQSQCLISATNLSFGSQAVTLGGEVTQTDNNSTITVTCTLGASYAVALDAGTGTGSTITDRKMSSGTNTLSYQLYANAARTSIWADGSGGSQTVGGTGTGVPVALTVYGRLAGQSATAPGDYASVVTATITY